MRYDEEEEVLLIAAEVVRISSCLDSGAVANVVGPDCVPGSTRLIPNATGRHYQGAGGVASRSMAVAQPALLMTKAVESSAHIILQTSVDH